MRYLEAFRDPALVPGLRRRIERAAARLGPVTLMEVCGTHTMAIARYGLRELLPRNIRLVSGPGCPVCVTPVGYIDHALVLARRPQTVIATFGDMLRVPGSDGSGLAYEQASGARVQVVLSSLDALKLAAAHPELEVVFLAVGFETTTPTVAATLRAAVQQGVRNLSALCAPKTVPAALDFLSTAGRARLDGLICPPHVSAIIGTRPYEMVAARGVACVVGGFEPLDILLSIAMLLEQRVSGVARVENEYSRVVAPEGNPRARAIVDELFEPCDAVWRGFGLLPGSGLRLRREHAALDAAQRFAVEVPPSKEPLGCRCGEVLMGAIEPAECPLFGGVCTPEEPVGACMVSSEGTCAAHYRYGVR